MPRLELPKEKFFREDDPRLIVKMNEEDFGLPPEREGQSGIINMAICLTSCKWGQGELGSTLLEHLLITLAENQMKPAFLILMDSAVFLATENCVVQSLEPLKALSEAGVKIMVSESSAQHYGQITSLRVGSVVKCAEVVKVLFSVEKYINI